MLYVKKVIAMLRSVLHDISIRISYRSDLSKSPDLVDVFSRISSSLDKLEGEFAEFFEFYKEVNKHE